MNFPQVTDLYVYPVKSTSGLALAESRVEWEGFRYDRRWAVVNEQGVVLTARDTPRLLAIRTALLQQGLEIEVPGFSPLALAETTGVEHPVEVELFGNPVPASPLSGAINECLSAYLQTPVRLVFMGADSVRRMSPKYGGAATDPVSYADTAPFLLVSQASLDELNSLMEHGSEMRSFRPNIVVSGCGPGEEDNWTKLRIGSVVLEQTETCKRCVMTTMDPVTGARHPDQEPLRTLATYRRHPRGGVRFGVNLVPRSLGLIRSGDRVEILE